MTIPEACQLVLVAVALGSGGEIFVFDMSKSVKIVDLARKMMKLSGTRSEKIFISCSSACVLLTVHERIKIAKVLVGEQFEIFTQSLGYSFLTLKV